MFAGWTFSGLQTAIPAVIAVLTIVIGFFRSNGRIGRLQKRIKESLELAKLAGEVGATATKARLDAVVLAQAEQLRVAEWKAENRQRDKNSLIAAIFILIVGVPSAWGLFLIEWVPTTVFAWVLVVFLAIFVPFGTVQFITGDPHRQRIEPPPFESS